MPVKPLPSVRMISVEVPDVTGAALNIPGRADPLFVIPFRDDGLKYAFTIDERTILFVTSEGSTTGLLLALFETTSGKFIQRTQLPGYLPDCRLSQDRRTLYLLPQLASVDTSTLALQQGYDFYFEDTGRIGRFGDYFEWKRTADEWDEVFHSRELQGQFESRPVYALRSDRRVFQESKKGSLVFRNEGYSFGKRPHRSSTSFVEVDLAAGNATRFGPAPHYIQRLDADRRLVISEEVAIPISDGRGSMQATVHGQKIATFNDHLDIADDKQWRFGAVLRLHNLDDMSVRSIVVRMATGAEWQPHRSRLSNAELSDCLCLAAAQIATPNDRALATQYLVRRDANGVDGTRIFPPEDFKSRGLAVYAQAVAIDPDAEAMWVWFNDDCIRRVGFNGELGPLIRFEPKLDPRLTARPPAMTFGEDGSVTVSIDYVGTFSFQPQALAPTDGAVIVSAQNARFVPREKADPIWDAFQAFAKQQFVTQIDVSDWTEAACSDALGKQAELLSDNYSKLVIGSFAKGLQFSYRVNGEIFTEAAFFQRILEAPVNVAGTLNVLLQTYLAKLGKGGEGDQPWETSDPDYVPALGSAMRALMLLDPTATGTFRAYLKSRDDEHENYCWTILRDLIGRHGWTNADLIRFGVFAVLDLRIGGLDPFGLFSASAKHMSAEQCSHLILDVIREMANATESASKVREWLIKQVFKLLDPTVLFQHDVVELLIGSSVS